MMSMAEKRISRRTLLKGLVFIPLINKLPKISISESEPNLPVSEREKWGPWQNWGPEMEINKGEANDGGRACLVFSQGQEAIYATLHHSVFYKDKKGWLKIPGADELGVIRHILKPERGVLMVADKGVHFLEEKPEQESQLRSFRPEHGDNFQTGCLVKSEGLLPDLLVGGYGTLLRISHWDNEEKISPLPVPGGPEGQTMYIRTIVVDPDNPETILIGGWWDYSDVNMLFWAGSGRVIAGTEGAGEWRKRVPDPDFPSLFISFNEGVPQTWRELQLSPWNYDLITPQQAMALGPKGELIVSCWGGPVVVTEKPLPLGSPRSEVLRLKCFSLRESGAGHLTVWQDDQGFHLATGGKEYNFKGIFTPLSVCSQIN